MPGPAMRPRTLRGVCPSEPAVHWRVDAAAEDPDLPLVVALHGWGMDEDFFALLLQTLLDRPFRILLPRAPFPVKSLAGKAGAGRNASSWYDYDGDPDHFRRELERTESLVLGIAEHVERELSLSPHGRYLVGFSQGGYCGSWVALRNPGLFDGMAVIGARVKTETLVDELPVAAKAGFRVLLCHGKNDTSVLPEAAERSRDGLAAAGIDVDLRWFDTGHTLGRRQGQVIGDWLADDRARRESALRP